MSNYFDRVSDILNQYQSEYSITVTLIDAKKYFAHTPKVKGQKIETLAEHLHLVEGYFLKLVEKHQLNRVINRLILDYQKDVNLASPELGNFIKKLFVYSIYCHDHGKINENFQASPEKMDNPHFKGLENKANKIDTQHSTLSSFIFLSYSIDNAIQEFKNKEQRCAITLAILFSYSIYRHHSATFQDDFWSKIINECQREPYLKPYLSKFKKQLNNPTITNVLGKLKTLKEQDFFSSFEKSFSLYQLLRLNFSLLTASDYLATNEYMSGFAIDKFGTLSPQRVEQLLKRVSSEDWIDQNTGKRNFNKKTYDEYHHLSLDKPQERNNANLNLLRQQMATEAIRNMRSNINMNVFYLEAPTGGGKTNISMLLALELLKANPELNKVFYVFPFTTLIDQTYKSIKESLGLSDKEIVTLHSRASESEDTKDDEYGSKKKNYINRLFINYPFCLLSHIRFFEILKTNFKETNYLLHRLANSIVVIDELQSYNPQHWDKVMYFIQKYADAYNIRFIIMSATLPKIGKLEIEGVNDDGVVYLIPDAKKEYFQNINFSGRIDFDFSLIEKVVDLDVLAYEVLKQSIDYAEFDNGVTKPKGSVFTIVEFIYKRTATQFKTEIEKANADFFDEIFVLSGTILHHRRRYIINYLKNPANRTKKILLITTQVVEAGVDIDMDIGFKDTSLLDSDEQLAGRINRNVNKNGCKLFLFDYNKEKVIYGKDLRYDVSKELSLQEVDHILKTKDFDFLYDKVIKFKNKRNKDQNFEGLSTYVNLIDNLQFRSVSEEFKLIDQKNFSCFIPMKIPTEIQGENSGKIELIFSKNDLKFLKSYGIIPDQDKKICGEAVFDFYLSTINAQRDFFEKKIELKQLQTILSKFVFSVFASPKAKTRFTQFADMEKSEYGYFYMNRWQEFYDELSGIDETAFDDIEKVQFI